MRLCIIILALFLVRSVGFAEDRPTNVIAKIEVVGLSDVQKKAVESQLWCLHVGDSFNNGLEDLDGNAIHNWLNSHGYLQSKVTPTVSKQDNKISIVYNCTQGELSHVRHIIINGLADDQQKQVLNDSGFIEGEPYSEDRIVSIEKILDKKFNYTCSHTYTPLDGKSTDLTIIFKQTQRHPFRIDSKDDNAPSK